MSIASRSDIIDYAKRSLGHPVIVINVDDQQLEDRLDDALQFFAEYHFDGVERTFLKHQITPEDIDNKYIPAPDPIVSVVRVFVPSIVNSGIFSYRYQYALNDMFTFGNMDLLTYDMTRQHYNLMGNLLASEPTLRFNRVQNRIHVEWDWERDAVVGQYMFFEVYRVLDPTEYPEIFNDRLLKKYFTALVKRQWGMNLKKFEGIQLPGGVTFNGQQLYDEASQEIERIEEQVQLNYEEPPRFFVG